MSRFKAGDKVIVKENQDANELKDNALEFDKVYTVHHTEEHLENADYHLLYTVEGPVAWLSRFELVNRSYSLKKFEKDIRKFNERCGNVDCTPDMSLAEVCKNTLPQAKVILEEANELLKALEEQNEQEIVDGAVDVLVTALRLISLLGKRYDLMKAAQLVMENNHLKYTDDLLLVQSWLAGTTYEMSVAEVKGKRYYCMKDDNGKIRKYEGFPKVELNVEELKLGTEN